MKNKSFLVLVLLCFNDENLLVEQGINARYINKKRKLFDYFGIGQYSGGLLVDVSVSSI